MGTSTGFSAQLKKPSSSSKPLFPQCSELGESCLCRAWGLLHLWGSDRASKTLSKTRVRRNKEEEEEGKKRRRRRRNRRRNRRSPGELPAGGAAASSGDKGHEP